MIVGVDPGVNGAMAWRDGGRLAHVADMPTVSIKRGAGTRQRVNAALLAGLLREWPADEAAVEAVLPRPDDTPMTAGYLMEALGIVLGVLGTLAVPVTLVAPQVWRRGMMVSLPAGSSYAQRKEASRQRALQLYPAGERWFRRKGDCDRAEAALIAGWLAQARAMGAAA